MKAILFLSILLAVLLAGNANADGISIEPGQWEMTTTMTMSMMPQPQTNTLTECIEEDEFAPEDFNMDEENPCDISEVTVNDDSAKWSINCPAGNGMVMEGSWEVTSTGDTLSGKGSMQADIAGQSMKFDMTWEGKRTGDC